MESVYGTSVDEGTRSDLEADLRGELLRPDEGEFDEARTSYNAMIDRRPGVIVRPTGTADVMTAVDFAREHDLLVAVEGAGHSVAGNAVCDDGLMIDLSSMRSVRVDPEAMTSSASARGKSRWPTGRTTSDWSNSRTSGIPGTCSG